ncbi:NurA domain-containing protein [Halalkaliarchaeum desulfuricum]|uniref:NurA domain-containing protein n=1 Tax=Halalkaliarchaeum desulfuricum TaxID=2055893 RepID=A0A343THB9_9EURY|nr:DNA double-strand break repair nuclease NurA [Halalkaliarchaeum desulfuricum]AUX08491.1 NurA domain-containing protein [Halalkaliarchaeum desulfuricum]
MTLDPIHVDNIARLASAIAEDVDDTDHDDLAATVWAEWLSPLRRGGRVVCEPVDEQELRAVPIDDAALADRPFEPVHGLDSGTINPTTFKNGLVLDVAQAAMASTPSDLDLHRSRSLVATVHTADTTVDHDLDWVTYDGGYSRRRVLHVPKVNRYAEGVVHALALYLAESDHALTHANTVTDLLILDGPIYPKELLTWEDRDPELGELAREAKPRAVVENYVRLVEGFLERDVPLVGFVKNPSSRRIVRTLSGKGVEAPWADDAGFFTRLLERRTDGQRDRDALTFTSWFRSRDGADEAFATDGDALGIDRRLPADAYEVTFFVLYDPRYDVLYKVEAPAAFTRDPDIRAALTDQIVGDVAAAGGPPQAVAKADELARVSASEKVALRRKFEEQFDSEQLHTYDDVRWDLTEF